MEIQAENKFKRVLKNEKTFIPMDEYYKLIEIVKANSQQKFKTRYEYYLLAKLYLNVLIMVLLCYPFMYEVLQVILHKEEKLFYENIKLYSQYFLVRECMYSLVIKIR